MAKPFDMKEAKQLLQRHKMFLARLETIKQEARKLQPNISDAAEKVIKREILIYLKKLPVEELNRAKQGFRVKTLRDYGLCTMADLAKSTVRQLSGIDGISPDAARAIKERVNEMVVQLRKSVKLRLSADDKNKEATALVIAVSRLKNCEEQLQTCIRFYDKNKKRMQDAVAGLEKACSSLKWMFASGTKKENAANGYRFLKELEQLPAYEKLLRLLSFIEKCLATKEREAWNDFSKDPISFFNLLERLVPEFSATDDTVYGLPEELANELAQQEYSLEGLSCSLRRYQEWGVRYILRQKRVLLGDEMGLGKTIQAIASMVALRNAGETHFMVVCPASVLANWCREIKKFSNLSLQKIYGDHRNDAFRLWKEQGGVAVTTYETTDHFAWEEEFQLTMLVVDEAHYIKNPNAKRTINVTAACRHSRRLLFMTGTALENRVEEMIALIELLNPKVASQAKGNEFLSSAPKFREIVAPVYYRRKREDVLTELPDLLEQEEWCTMGPQEEAVYETAVLEGSFSDARRVSWNVGDITQSSKANRMLELIEQAREESRKIIVFSYFLDTIRIVTELLGDGCIGPINGSVPPERRQEMIDEFDKAPAGTVLAAQIQAGGTGLNIQSASVVILCEPQFKPSIENQAISRVYRMGQSRNVLVFRLLCEDTVDEHIMQLLEEKQNTFDQYADRSVAAEQTEINEAAFGNILKDEANRIKAKQSAVENASSTTDDGDTPPEDSDGTPPGDSSDTPPTDE